MRVRSLQTQLLGVLIPLMLSVVGVIAALGYVQGRQLIEADIRQAAADSLDEIVRGLEADLRPHARMVEVLARRVERAPAQPSLAWFRQTLDEVLQASPESKAFGVWYEPYRFAGRRQFGVYLYRQQGRVYFSTAYSQPAHDYFGWQWYRRGAGSPSRAVWSPVYLDPVSKVKTVTAAAPFRSPRGRLLGVVAGDLALADLRQLVVAKTDGKPGWVLLLDSDGRYVATPAAGRVLRTRIQQDPNLTLAAAGRRMMARRQGTDGYAGVSGPVRLFYRTIPNTDWRVAVAIPESTLYAPLQRWLSLSLLVALGAGCVAIAGALWLTKRLTEPIANLLVATRQLRVGDFPTVDTGAALDELATLEHSFNAMSRRLHDSSEALGHERERLAAIIASLAEGLLIVNAAGDVTDHNESAVRLLGATADSLNGRTCATVLGPACLQGGEAIIERPVPGRTGEESRTFRISRVPLAEGSSVITFRDISHEAAISRMKSEFISLASHELRTPLMIAKGYVDLAQLPALPNDGPERRRQMLHQASRQLDRLSRIITDLLNVSRIEQRRLPWRPKPIDAAQLLDDVAQTLQAEARQRNQVLALSLPDAGPPQAWADPDHVLQIVTNLVDNAIKYAGPGRRITLSLTGLSGWLRLTVSDDGPGIPTAELARIFDQFHRVPGQTSLKERGSGLGLYLSRRLAHLQGGILLACSAEGAGASFALMLPAAVTANDGNR